MSASNEKLLPYYAEKKGKSLFNWISSATPFGNIKPFKGIFLQKNLLALRWWSQWRKKVVQQFIDAQYVHFSGCCFSKPCCHWSATLAKGHPNKSWNSDFVILHIFWIRSIKKDDDYIQNNVGQLRRFHVQKTVRDVVLCDMSQKSWGNEEFFLKGLDSSYGITLIFVFLISLILKCLLSEVALRCEN